METNGPMRHNSVDILRSKPQHQSQSNRRVKTDHSLDTDVELVKSGTFLRPKWKIVSYINKVALHTALRW